MPEDVWRMLGLFERTVVSGKPIDQRLQAAVNIVMAEALRNGRLPLKRAGAPVRKREVERQRASALKLLALTEKGAPISAAVQTVAKVMHRDERRVYEHWKKHRTWATKYSAHQRDLAALVQTASVVLRGVGAIPTASALDRVRELFHSLPNDEDGALLFRSARDLREYE